MSCYSKPCTRVYNLNTNSDNISINVIHDTTEFEAVKIYTLYTMVVVVVSLLSNNTQEYSITKYNLTI